MARKTSSRFVFGLAVPENLTALDASVGALIRWIGTKAGLELVRFQVPSYEALARQMSDGALHVAWLPPIVFVRLERDGVATALVASRRGGSAGYESVLLVRASSKIHTLDGLRGARAAWVDPLSAAGYVLPRIQLAALGIDPRGFFGVEHFCGSHAAAVRAVLDGEADVAATFAGLDRDGAVVRGGWTEQPEGHLAMRVLATFGEIPPDLIAVRNDVSPQIQRVLASAFTAACRDETMGPIIKRVFGVDAFAKEGFASYDGLRRTIDAAAERGLLDLSVVHSSRLPTRPPQAQD